MKYTREYINKDGKKSWTFLPPKDVRDAGVCEAQTFTDGRAFRYAYPRLLELVEKYRKGEIREGGLSERSKFVHLRNHYFNSDHFKATAPNTQVDYARILSAICGVMVRGRPFGHYLISDINVSLCRDLYNTMVKESSIYTANAKATLLSVVLNYGIGLELFHFNPMSKVKKLKHESKTTIWTREEVEQFLEAGYREFDTRNITLLAHMCYEWAQRPKDIRLLTWDAFNWDVGFVTITQTKRGAEVYLPLEEPLRAMLQEQHEDWGFQPLVVPHTVPSGSVYKPMTRGQTSIAFHKVRERAGLDIHLKLGAMRATAITEMVEAGVDVTGIKQVSGHKTLQSLNPYVKNTRRGAARALTQRKNT